MRCPRLKLIGSDTVYHVTSRIIGGRRLIDASGRDIFRSQLLRTAEFCGVELLTYVVLSNHFHILVRVPGRQPNLDHRGLLKRYEALYPHRPARVVKMREILERGDGLSEQARCRLLARMGDISSFLKELKQLFSIWYNATNGHYGTLWASRFKSTLVEDEPTTLQWVAAYIDLNPLRAGMAKSPEEYQWSGYADARRGEDQLCRGIEVIMAARTCSASSLGAYRELLHQRGMRQVKDFPHPTLPEANVSGQPNLLTTFRPISDGGILGSPSFVLAIATRLTHQISRIFKRELRPHPIAPKSEASQVAPAHNLATLYRLRGPIFRRSKPDTED
jgi:REP element-mobilizing transposase RayT